MSMLKKSLTTVAVTGALLGGAFATPAAAADSKTCPSGKVCGWSGTNRTGHRTVLSVTPGCETFTGARSVSNQTSYRIEFWHITPGTGCGVGSRLVTLQPHTYSDNVHGTATGIAVWGK
ncbi:MULTISPECIES: peptidase inhibitor family I36 protein [Streptomyces]|uniref:Peptidase inhibitor family I36 protein n=1 Tax=Streptomyces albidocamelliae TaxID=2981135 RepID=A0ABY6ERS0_9ACTN|nr:MULTISPECIES: peptidase inhibitor family I36 protein [unclassified Streptomyces]ROP51891.1 peptidase inhibitor family I36 [Streptomyces sp. PanSC9]UXY37049.1 peptidase inhibitor family I36 protein [Streptomyces sp. HUAS 14-6]